MDTARESLLEAAEALFAARGFDGTPIRAVADAAGVNLALIKYYFGSKEGLLAALLDERGRGLTDAVARAADDAGPEPILLAYARWLLDRPAFAALVFREAALPHRPALAAQATRLRDLARPHVRDPAHWPVVLGLVMAGVLGEVPVTVADVAMAIGRVASDLAFEPPVSAPRTEEATMEPVRQENFGIGFID